MLTLQVWNVSDLAPVSDYHYAVYIGRERIATGSVNGHRRDDGWPALVKQIAEAHTKACLPKTPAAEWFEAFVKAEPLACGLLRERDGAICCKPKSIYPDGTHRHKFVKIRPA